MLTKCHNISKLFEEIVYLNKLLVIRSAINHNIYVSLMSCSYWRHSKWVVIGCPFSNSYQDIDSKRKALELVNRILGGIDGDLLKQQWVMTSHVWDKSSYNYFFSPPCSNGPAFIFMCHTLRSSAMSSVILYSFMASLMSSSHLFLGLPPLLFPSMHLHVQHLLGGVLPFLPQHVAIPYQSSLSDESCNWFDVGFSPYYVFILDVVLVGLAFSPSQHSHLSSV